MGGNWFLYMDAKSLTDRDNRPINANFNTLELYLIALKSA